MTREEEQYYEQYFDLFLTTGWKQFVGEIKDILDSHRIEDIRDDSQLAYIKGERRALHRVAHFEAGIKNSYNMILEREDAHKT